MKKILFLIIIFSLGIILMACKNEKTTENNSTNKIITTTINNLKSNHFDGVILSDSNDVYQNETSIFSFIESSSSDIKNDENLNPYDESSISIDCTFTSPSNKTYYRPAYWTVDYTSSLNTLINKDTTYYDDELIGQDMVNKEGIEHFNVSFKPFEIGEYKCKCEVYVNNILSETISFTFNSIENTKEYKGKIVVNDTNERYFMYENTKETFIPVGLNNAWYSSTYRKSYDYDEWFKRMTANNINFTRIWMASWGFGLHIGTGSKVDDFTNRLNQAARLERVLKLAESEGIYCYLTLINHGQFSTEVNAEWNINSYNTLISKPYNFWTTESCKKAYKNELRYIIARYGTYDSICAWELFNEVDWTDMSSLYKDKIKEWHKEMSEYINSIDCYNRLVSTSYIYETGSSYSLDSIDIANIHCYDFSKGSVFDKCKEKLDINYNNYHKIVMLQEWGLNADSGEKTYELDPDGISLYQSLYGTLLQGGAGTSMTWWWDSYVHKYNLYTLYKGIGEFTKFMDLSGDITYLNESDITTDKALKMIGIKSDDNYYLYLYDKDYTRLNKTVNTFDTSITGAINNGEYEVIEMNPLTGDILSSTNIEVENAIINLKLTSFNTDTIIIINKK